MEKLSDQVACKLDKDLSSFKSPFLPPVMELASRYRVSRRCMLEALKKLRQEGRLHFQRGSKIQVLSNSVSAEQTV